ncbi:MAG TPA: class I SAM-dependent methyltransferase [Blastocatellia bacterium]|nr:class I SAM-dependent methyltransferase [Blastocatellia bacterium]
MKRPTKEHTPIGGSLLPIQREAVCSELGLEDFARLFDTTISKIPMDCRKLIAGGDFRYRKLDRDESDAVLLDALKKIDSGQFSVAGKDGKSRWERGWSGNLEEFKEHSYDLTKLVPKYIRQNQPLRLDQSYITPVHQDFELNWYEVFRLWLFRTYFDEVDTVYEFGCGTGFNLAVLAQLYPSKTFYGLDWTAASRDIVNQLAKTYGWKMTGLLFDFFSPDKRVKIAENSAILTIGALEQTGRDYETFLHYLLSASPRLCVHVEPIVEWYDENNLLDYAAIRFHKKREYWEGFPNRLRELEREGKVEVLKAKRSYFGSLYLEGYSQLIWRPVNRV